MSEEGLTRRFYGKLYLISLCLACASPQPLVPRRAGNYPRGKGRGIQKPWLLSLSNQKKKRDPKKEKTSRQGGFRAGGDVSGIGGQENYEQNRKNPAKRPMVSQLEDMGRKPRLWRSNVQTQVWR